MGRLLLLLLLLAPARLSGDTEERTRADGEAERTRGRTVFGGNVRVSPRPIRSDGFEFQTKRATGLEIQ
jgi:hypothetical protein